MVEAAIAAQPGSSGQWGTPRPASPREPSSARGRPGAGERVIFSFLSFFQGESTSHLDK